MEDIDIGLVAITGLLAIALIIFLIWKNKKDRKKHLPPTPTNPVEQTKSSENQGRNTL